MPLFLDDTYVPPLLLRNGHTNTLYTYYKGQTLNTSYQRERINTPDSDFIDIDFIRSSSDSIILLLHGLEGSSQSQYIQKCAAHYTALGYDVAAMNHRSCSGELNRTTTMYHSGFTLDLNTTLHHLKQDYRSIFIIGFSMGGNSSLKYSGEEIHPIPDQVKGIATVSVPIELRGSSFKISSWYNTIYEKEFLKTLLEKAKLKQQQFPELIDAAQINKIQSLLDFDDYFTGPLHGFKDGLDYYSKSSALQYLNDQRLPALLITSEDDPFLSKECYPAAIAKYAPYFFLHQTKYGGHVGYYTTNSDNPYYLSVIDRFITEVGM